MKITIHRGTDQIGGCITEYEHNGWRLFIDYGEQLPGSRKSDKRICIEGLNHGDVSRSALLITHYHGDHVGDLTDIPAELPIFIGKTAAQMLSLYCEHVSSVSEVHKNLASRVKVMDHFEPGVSFEFGEFSITPISVDHSAFDAYAFKIEAGNLSVYHSGDFRAHGFRSGLLHKLLDKYIGKVDYVVCEGTNISRPDAESKPEYILQREFLESFKNNKYNVVYVSSTNIDRIFGLYRSAMQAGRPFIVDGFQKQMMDIIAESEHLWSKARLYKYGKYEPMELLRNGNEFLYKPEFDEFLKDKGYVLLARASERFDNLLGKMPDDGRKVYLSMWDGYVNKEYGAYNPALAKSIGSEWLYMHTSGHCDTADLHNILHILQPKAIIPIHTDNPENFALQFSDNWPVLLLKDGQSFHPVRNPNVKDPITANIYAMKEPDTDIDGIKNPYYLRWGKLDEKNIGQFSSHDEALDALRSVVYAPDRVLGYSIEEEDSTDTDYCAVYSPEGSLLAEYNHGGHRPGEKYFQEPCIFKKGDIVFSIFSYGNNFENLNAIIPCEVLGPVTETIMRKIYESDDFCPYQTFEEYDEYLTDSTWDSMAVRPLVRLKGIGDEELVPRIYLFPYKSFLIREIYTKTGYWLFARLTPKETGVNATLWVSERQYGLEPFIIVGTTNSLRSSDIMISINDYPKVLAPEGAVVPETLLHPVQEWINLNKDLLIKYWEGDIGTGEFCIELKKIK
ncbi:MAG: hypothetical protein K2O00_02665 [Muribaculaceae bacterium]|nr:hypothetical protein [Muribaculaceae bacterium]